MCCFAMAIGTGLGFDAPLYIYFIVFPVSTLILALPLTPAGLGVGDMALLEGFYKFGVDKNLGGAFLILVLSSHDGLYANYKTSLFLHH